MTSSRHPCALQLDVLDGVLKVVTSPDGQASETQPQKGDDSLGSANLVEQLDIEEAEQSKLPRYLERFQVICSRIEPFPASATHKGIKSSHRELQLYCLPQAMAFQETSGIFMISRSR